MMWDHSPNNVCLYSREPENPLGLSHLRQMPQQSPYDKQLVSRSLWKSKVSGFECQHSMAAAVVMVGTATGQMVDKFSFKKRTEQLMNSKAYVMAHIRSQRTKSLCSFCIYLASGHPNQIIRLEPWAGLSAKLFRGFRCHFHIESLGFTMNYPLSQQTQYVFFLCFCSSILIFQKYFYVALGS